MLCTTASAEKGVSKPLPLLPMPMPMPMLMLPHSIRVMPHAQSWASHCCLPTWMLHLHLHPHLTFGKQKKVRACTVC